MPQATRPLFNRIAPVFDFDDTLAETSFDALLEHCGLEPDTWDSNEDVQPGRREVCLAPPDYTEEGELTRSLVLATEATCKKVALRRLSVGE